MLSYTSWSMADDYRSVITFVCVWLDTLDVSGYAMTFVC
jgi:hypothetical protein